MVRYGVGGLPVRMVSVIATRKKLTPMTTGVEVSTFEGSDTVLSHDRSIEAVRP